ncbi:MAG: beta-lactamase family protein [Betaproteobacteria bacterium]|nr:beta-lactamase family protein [Betaproteobacteria bacterium]
MPRFSLSLLLLCTLPLAVDANPARPKPGATSWTCLTAKDAQDRRRSVEQGMFPGVIFEDETKATNIESRMSERQIRALSVAVIRAGKLDWSGAYGRQGDDAPATQCNTLFQGGSLAKPVTLLAALRMSLAGKIDLDRNIDLYLKSYQLLPGKQSATKPVTFRNLLAHTAGITPGGYAGYAHGQPLPTDVETVNASGPANTRKVEVLNEPGAALAYSGGGYTVAEIALQDRFGEPFETLMKTWILGPVGMRQAEFTQPLPAARHAHTALGHGRDQKPVPGGWHNHPEQAAAGLWATPTDMATLLIEVWKAYHGNSAVFTQAGVRELLERPVEGHAHGFRVIGEGDQRFITHYGGTTGYNAGMTLNLASGHGAVYMTNSESGGSLGREFLQSVSRVYAWPMFRATTVKRASRPAEVIRALVGTYHFAESDSRVKAEYADNTLTLVFPNGDRYAMAPVVGGPREFIHPATGVRAAFEGEGAELGMRLYGELGKRQP